MAAPKRKAASEKDAKPSKPSAPPKEKRAKTDWESVESQYRANVVSLRVIATQYGITEGAIRKRAKADGWERDLSHQVRKAAKEKLVRIESTQAGKSTQKSTQIGTQTGTQDLLKDDEVVALAAEVIVSVARDHRKKLRVSRSIAENMLAELMEASEQRAEIESAIEDETHDDPPSSKRRGAMLRAVALPTRAGVLLNLSAAMKNIISLERQSFSMDERDPGVTPHEDWLARLEEAL